MIFWTDNGSTDENSFLG